MAWPSVLLADAAAVFNGKTPSKPDQRSAGHPVLKIRDVSAHGRFRGPFESYVDEAYIRRLKQKLLRRGDSLILNAAHNVSHVASKTYFAEPAAEGALITGEWLVIRPDEKIVDAHFLNHWLNAPRTRASLRNVVNGIHLYPRDVARLPIPVPPIEEQRQIASTLDAADAIRVKRGATVDLLADLVQSVFLDMFGMHDAYTEFGAVILAGPTNGLYRPSSDYGSGSPILRIDSFGLGEVTARDLKRVRITAPELERYSLAVGDIVINRVNALSHLGKSALIERLNEPSVFESNMMRIRLNPRLALPSYVIAWLQTPSVKQQILSKAKKAINQASINQSDVRTLIMPAAPLSDQMEFGRRVDGIINQRNAARLGFDGANSLFGALQEQAFYGQL